jgi:N6-adenosine-specific RNA methylase IME4
LNGKYKTVVIDFPWPVEGISASAAKKMKYGRRLQMPYKTMTLKEIRAFPINDFAAEQCAIFVWTTQGFLKAALDIVDQWGFKFSKLITWDKVDGINWLGFKTNSEFVIFAYRGKYPLPINAHVSIRTSFRSLQGRHSEKPAKFYQMILPFPEPRIDIFARKRHYGFDAWGDQVQEAPLTIEQFQQ